MRYLGLWDGKSPFVLRAGLLFAPLISESPRLTKGVPPSAAANRRALVAPDERAFAGGGQGIGLCASYMYAPKGTEGKASNLTLEKGRSQLP